MKFVDSHCHLNMDFFKDDWKKVANKAYENNVKIIITIGTNYDDSKKGIKISEELDFVYTSVGWHPHDTKNIKNFDDILKLMELAKNSNVVAIGEIGLDFYKNYSPPEIQEKYFRIQINVARELKLPIIIHDRDAHNDVYKILKEEKAYEVGGVFHCFSGDYSFAKKVFDLNFFISFPGTITFRRNRFKAKELIQKVPLNMVLTETDAPFLTPEPFRGKRNEPKFVKYVTQKIAEFRQIEIEKLCEIVYENTIKLFKINKNG